MLKDITGNPSHSYEASPAIWNPSQFKVGTRFT